MDGFAYLKWGISIKIELEKGCWQTEYWDSWICSERLICYNFFLGGLWCLLQRKIKEEKEIRAREWRIACQVIN